MSPADDVRRVPRSAVVSTLLAISLSSACLLTSACASESVTGGQAHVAQAVSSESPSYTEDVAANAIVSEPRDLNESGSQIMDGASAQVGTVQAGAAVGSDDLNAREAQKLATWEESIASRKKTYALGETVLLTNVDGMTPFLAWNGTLETTVLDATLYDSLEEAQTVGDLGTVLTAEAPSTLSVPQVLVMHVRVTNIDAVMRDPEEAALGFFSLDAFQPSYPRTADGIMDNLTWRNYFSAELAAFDGVPEGLAEGSRFINDYALATGETRTLTMAWWVDGAHPSLITLRPSLSASNPGPITFDLGLGSSASGDAAAGDSDAAA